jgi:hypothetical protein
MSGIEIGLVTCIAVLTVWCIFLQTSLTSLDERISDSLNNTRHYHLGYTPHGYGGKHPLNAPPVSVHNRINLLMDHLNLEIKKGEPSKAVLVKKKPVKKGK